MATLGPRARFCAGVIGEVVGGRYKITRRISSGGMGVVCEAIHEATGRRVALKIIRDSESFGEEKDAWLARFKREARAAGTIDTPHITQVFDASTDDATGQPYIAMELLVGNDLSRTLKNLGPLPPTVALKAIAQACVGLERAHDAGVIHRDIKPGNIFLSEGHAGRITVKLVDFGIAKVVEEDPTGETAELTQTGSLLGTPTYMSPEQAKGLKNIDHRADLWALGVVLYKALSDTVPHPKRDGLGQLIVSICTEAAPAIQGRAGWITPEVAQILDRALQIDPERRFQTARELREAIEALLPQGTALNVDELRGLTEDERATVAPRYNSTFPALDPESLHMARRGGHEESATQPGFVQAEPAPRKKRPHAFWFASGATLLLAAGGTGVWLNQPSSKDSAVPAPVSEARLRPTPTSSVRPMPPERLIRAVVVQIKPTDARVEVAGTPVEVVDGKISVEGKLGTTVEVRVFAESAEKTFTVAVTEKGAMPNLLALEANEKPTGARPAVAAASPKPVATPPPSKPKPGTGVGVVKDFE